MWIFDFSNLQLNSKNIEKHKYSLTILINEIKDVDLLLKTLDSIQSRSSYEKIKLILFNHTAVSYTHLTLPTSDLV